MCCRRLDKDKKEEQLFKILLMTLDYLGLEMFRHYGQEISHHLNQIVSIPFEICYFILYTY